MNMLLWIVGAFFVGTIVGHIVGIVDYKRDHGPGGFFYDNERFKRDEYRQGIIAASGYIRQFNPSTTHDWDLGDCVLAKFNLMSGKGIRRNLRRLKVSKRG